MQYIFINPVVANMYIESELDAALLQNGYTRVNVSEDWHGLVKEKYKQFVSTANQTVLDQRCPKAVETVLPYVSEEQARIPSIHPILIHCGIELADREDLKGFPKVITTPCQSLADYGNALGLADTKFIAWNEFLKQLHLEKPIGLKALDSSPIPPGYFRDFEGKVASISGKETIEQYFQDESYLQDTLVEMLYCENGCHNGDGVCVSEDA